MSLSKDYKITASDFNNLKDSIANEVLRRAKRSNFPTAGQTNELGNDYNQNTFTTVSNISTKTAITDIITESYFQTILNFFKNFYYNNPNKYPENLDNSYKDDDVNIGDVIYALNELSTYLSTLQTASSSETGRQDNNDCRSGCMGLCTDSCKNQCTSCTSCTSCSGCSGCSGCGGLCEEDCSAQCMDNCDTGCSGTCKTNCWQNSCYSTGCSGDCAASCGNSCSGNCTGTCSGCGGYCGGCTGSCTGNCSGSCSGTCSGCGGYCGGCSGSCSSTCSGQCTGTQVNFAYGDSP